MNTQLSSASDGENIRILLLGNVLAMKEKPDDYAYVLVRKESATL